MHHTTSYIYKYVGFIIVFFLFHLFAFTLFGIHDDIARSDVIVVLGNTVNIDGTPSDRLRARLDKAVELYQAGAAPYVIVSGGLGKEGHWEGDSMESHLVSKGIPNGAIYIDNAGDNTLASAQHVAQIMKEKGMHSVIVVSQYFHLFRAVSLFKKVGLTPVYHAHANYFELRDLYSLPREVLAYYWHFVQ